MHCVTLLQKPYIHVRQYIALLFCCIILSEQQCVTGNSTVYCLMSVCSCFVMVLKFYIFSTVTHCRRRRGVLMVWRVAILPMSCYIVRKITTKGVSQSYAGYLTTSQSLVALWSYVSTEFRFFSSSNLCDLRIGTMEVSCGVKSVVMWGWSSCKEDVTGAKEMCSVSVSHSKVLRLLVVDWHWKYGV